MKPSPTTSPTGRLSLDQFIQQVLSGVSGVPGNLVRPKWQAAPPKDPDLIIDWIAYGIIEGIPDANAYLGTDANGVTTMQRHQEIEVGCSIYGPNAMLTAGLIRDGFQIPDNVSALRSANMGFKEVNQARHVPDLVGERFVNRIEMSVFLRQEIGRTYPILTLVKAAGSIETDNLGGVPYDLAWQTKT